VPKKTGPKLVGSYLPPPPLLLSIYTLRRSTSPIWACPQALSVEEKRKRKKEREREKLNRERSNKSVEQRA